MLKIYTCTKVQVDPEQLETSNRSVIGVGFASNSRSLISACIIQTPLLFYLGEAATAPPLPGTMRPFNYTSLSSFFVFNAYFNARGIGRSCELRLMCWRNTVKPLFIALP